MCGAHVGVQLPFLRKLNVTLLTRVLVLVGMNFGMSPQSKRSLQSYAANFTNVRLHAAVHPLVLVQLRCVDESFPTQLANVRSLARVSPLVFDHRSSLDESFGAVRAPVRHFACVRSQVDF